ncbi:loricrin-like [Schistocerca nitens]|uniref:loricrin-like n=1 Tax=Schistocerca nitens TaxID=7011 RepID=UPI0021181E68|nr:loricrin-like [Schistocerca nitens]
MPLESRVVGVCAPCVVLRDIMCAAHRWRGGEGEESEPRQFRAVCLGGGGGRGGGEARRGGAWYGENGTDGRRMLRGAAHADTQKDRKNEKGTNGGGECGAEAVRGSGNACLAAGTASKCGWMGGHSTAPVRQGGDAGGGPPSDAAGCWGCCNNDDEDEEADGW